MRKILTLFLVLLFFLLYFPKQAKAIWIKQVTQPVLSAGQSGTWDDQSVGSPFIIPDGSILKMWYEGTNGANWRIGYTTSSDGIHWSNRQKVIDILPDDSNNKNAHNPKVVFRNNNYQMWYASSTLAISNIHINYTQSPDGINWNQLLIDIMPPSLDWEKSNGISFPFVLFSDNKYKMWYGAYGTIRGLRQWRIGYATSQDGIQWERHPEPVLEADQNWENVGSGEGIGNPNVLLENGVYHMWYHADRDIGHATSTDGIHWIKDPQNPVLRPDSSPAAFDNFRVTDPFILKKNNIYYLYYSGEDTNGRSRIGLATSEVLPIPSLSPTSAPSPIPTPTTIPTHTPTPTTYNPQPTTIPTPSITLFAPIILIPGFGASWNPRAFFSCDTSMTSGWQLAPYVSLYNRLIQTLTKNAHLLLNRDFYIYPYDWRQPLDTQSVLLKNFIDSILAKRPSGTQVRLIGHSFGGLIMRSYLSNNPFTHKALSALTVGTPHQGTVMVYPMWENGEIWTDNRLMQIALSQLIGHCRLRNSFISRDGGIPKINIFTRRETVQKFAPSVKNLLPLFDYLRENGSIKQTTTLIHQNDWLLFHPFTPTFFGVDFSTLSGNNKETIRFLDVTTPSQSEIRLGNWLDGKPKTKEFTLFGDGTVLGISSLITGGNNVNMTGNHQDIISTKEAIEKILAFLRLTGISPASPASLPEETSTRFFTVTLDVEAKLELTTPKREKRDSTENILVLFDPSAGFYTLRITPSMSGPAYLHLTVSEQNEGISAKTYLLSLSQNRPITYRLAYSGKAISIPQLMPVFSSTFSDNQ